MTKIWNEIWSNYPLNTAALILWAIFIFVMVNMARPKPPRFRQIEIKFVPLCEAHDLIKLTAHLPESAQWRMVKESAAQAGMVMIERRERIK